jgi:tRNA (adenine57-N1/adenine58-N1)-methyltransferase catalytic subunit
VGFACRGLDGLVIAQHRDVCEEGLSGIVRFADCAFLDLPAPWDAIPHLLNVSTRTQVARVCCFSPCIEQVLATHSALRKSGFTNITTYTLQYRNYEVRSLPMHSVEEACDRLYNIKQRVKQGLPREP